jgi:hypothetical protein
LYREKTAPIGESPVDINRKGKHFSTKITKEHEEKLNSFVFFVDGGLRYNGSIKRIFLK